MATQTARQVLTRAFRRLKQVAGEEAMTAAELSDGLVTMNGAMHGFNRKGIHYAHVDLAATDTVNMPDDLIDSLVWAIADALAPEYYYQFTPGEQAAVIEARQVLQAAYKSIPPQSAPRGLLRNRGYGYFSMQRGE